MTDAINEIVQASKPYGLVQRVTPDDVEYIRKKSVLLLTLDLV